MLASVIFFPGVIAKVHQAVVVRPCFLHPRVARLPNSRVQLESQAPKTSLLVLRVCGKIIRLVITLIETIVEKVPGLKIIGRRVPLVFASLDGLGALTHYVNPFDTLALISTLSRLSDAVFRVVSTLRC